VNTRDTLQSNNSKNIETNINHDDIKSLIRRTAEKYNDYKYFKDVDPITFPHHFYDLFKQGKASLQDIEISGLFAAHLAWGRRDMIVRDTKRLLDEMRWQPYNYVMRGISYNCNPSDIVIEGAADYTPEYRSEDKSIHRTIKWRDIAKICSNLRRFYLENQSLAILSPAELRTEIFGQKPDKNAANKKIHMYRRWMVRNDGLVDLGIWKNISPKDLIIPLDIHVFNSAQKYNMTKRNNFNIKTALEITEYLNEIFPGDPTKGDFALFQLDV